MNLSESPAVLSVDTPITWYSKTAQTQCKYHLCKYRLRIYKIAFDKAVVILSERQDNSRGLIMEEASRLIHWVCHEFELSPSKITWLEHYPAKHLREEDIYEQVILVQPHLYSIMIDKQKIEDLLGVNLTL